MQIEIINRILKQECDHVEPCRHLSQLTSFLITSRLSPNRSMSLETPIGLTRTISWISFGLQHKCEDYNSSQTSPIQMYLFKRLMHATVSLCQHNFELQANNEVTTGRGRPNKSVPQHPPLPYSSHMPTEHHHLLQFIYFWYKYSCLLRTLQTNAMHRLCVCCVDCTYNLSIYRYRR